MSPRFLYKLFIFLILSTTLVFAWDQVIVGDFLLPQNLEKEHRRFIRDNNDLKLVDSLHIDLDMKGRQGLILSSNGLILVFDKGDTLRLSKESGQILAFDCNNDGIPDLVHKMNKDWLFYETRALQKLLPHTIFMQEDSTLLLQLPFAGFEGSVDYNFNIDTSHISLKYEQDGVRIIPEPDWHGSETLKITYSRGSLSHSVDHEIVVISVNDLPRLVSQPDELMLLEDGVGVIPFDSILTCVYDPDGQEDLKLRLLGSRRNCRRIGKNYIYKPKKDWSGKDTLYFWVSDQEAGDTVVQYITVIPVNDAPKWMPITILRFPEDEFKQLPLSLFSDHASDVDTPDSLLRYYAFSGEYVSISTEGGKITLLADENWFGEDSVLLTVSDGELEDSIYWKIEITPVNDAPVLSAIPDTCFNEDEGLIISRTELEPFAYDVETDTKDLKWQIQSLGKIKAYYNGSYIRLSTPQDWFGFDSLKVTVSDGELYDSQIWRIHIFPVNDPPRWRRSSIHRSFLEDESLTLKRADLFAMVRDPETPSKDLLWEVLPSSHIYVDEFKDRYVIRADENWFGNSNILFVVNDGEYADTMNCKIKVISVNDKPQMLNVPRHSWKEDETLSISKDYLNTYASDVETKNSDLIWSFFSDRPQVSIKEEKENITLYSAPDWNGTARIGLVIFDGGLRDTAYMDITVIPVNDAPRWTAFPDTSIAEDSYLSLPFDYIRKFVSDPDDGDEITLEYLAGKNFYIEHKKDMIVLWPKEDWFGQEKLFITASDGKEKSKITWDITVFGVNDPPYFTMALPDSLTFYANGSDTLFLDEIVHDVDNTSSELEWVITDGSITRHIYDEKLHAYIFHTENFESGEDVISVSVTDGVDIISTYIPVLVKEADRFLMANPVKLELLPNTPNPFQEFTDIRFSMPQSGYVTLKIYDLLGQEIITLVEGYHDAQNYSVRWFGETDSGMSVPSGVYLSRMVAVIDGEPAVLMRKMMLVR